MNLPRVIGTLLMPGLLACDPNEPQSMRFDGQAVEVQSQAAALLVVLSSESKTFQAGDTVRVLITDATAIRVANTDGDFVGATIDAIEPMSEVRFWSSGQFRDTDPAETAAVRLEVVLRAE